MLHLVPLFFGRPTFITQVLSWKFFPRLFGTLTLYLSLPSDLLLINIILYVPKTLAT